MVGIKISTALATAAATAPLRIIADADPSTWEFTGFSQNGEDGIIDYLTRRMTHSTRHFLEIGASDGLENNTAWLVFARRFSGTMVEGDRKKSRLSKLAGPGLRAGVECLNLFVDLDHVDVLMSRNAVPDIDVLSVDIDGIDYHIVRALLESGIRPAIAVLEYNATFGPERAVTVPYDPIFDHRRIHPSRLYFGASLMSWRLLGERHGLRFLTVEQNGVNAFLVDPTRFPKGFVEKVNGCEFRDNFYQRHEYRMGWEGRMKLIEGLELESVEGDGD